MPLPCSLPCTCKVTFLSATPAGLAATQVKVPESANCTWEILNPSRERAEREREGPQWKRSLLFSILSLKGLSLTWAAPKCELDQVQPLLNLLSWLPRTPRIKSQIPCSQPCLTPHTTCSMTTPKGPSPEPPSGVTDAWLPSCLDV